MNSILPLEELPKRDYAAIEAARELAERAQCNVLIARAAYGYDLYRVVSQTIPPSMLPKGPCYFYTYNAPTRAQETKHD